MTFRNGLRAAAAATALSAAMTTAIPAAIALQTEQTAPEQAQPRQGIETITVTATRREENVQDVPAVVTALSGDLMRDAGVRDIKDLQILTPGMTVTSTSNETITTARIRGIGTVGDNPGLESSVGVLIDGVYRPRNGVGFGDLGELERIEVLKGPQGTLFGKNTSAGVINIISAGPEFEFGAGTQVTAGNFGQIESSGFITGPVSETVAGRLYVGTGRRDGYLDVADIGPGPRTKDEDVDQDFWTARGQLLFTPTNDLEVRLIADYTDRDENCCLGTQVFIGDSPQSRANIIRSIRPGSLPDQADPFAREAYANRDTTQSIEDMGVSAEANWDINPDLTLTTVTALRQWNTFTGQDSDFTAADLVYRPNDGTNYLDIGQFSQEVRLNGRNGSLDWIVGAFYADEEIDTRAVLSYGEDYYAYFANGVLGGAPGLIGLTPDAALQPGNGSDDTHRQEGESFALFTDNTYDLTDRLRLSFGARYTMDDKTLTSDYTTTGGTCDTGEAAFPILAGAVGAETAATIVGGLCLNGQNAEFDRLGTLVQEQSEEELSGSVRARYDLTDAVMAYASYARGYKSGGFNLERSSFLEVTAAGPDFRANPDTSFAPETVDAFEIGLKSELLDNTLLLNVGAFHQTYENFQLNTFAGTAFIVETLPEVVSKGVEMDFNWAAPVDGLTFQGGLTYADTTASEFTRDDLAVPDRFDQSLFRLPGATMPFAPKWSGSVSGTYETAVSATHLVRANVSVKYMSDYNTGSDLHPTKFQEGHPLVNARLGFGAQDQAWMLELWAENLTDEEYLQVGFNGPFQVDEADDSVSTYNGFLGAPRTWGATLRFRY